MNNLDKTGHSTEHEDILVEELVSVGAFNIVLYNDDVNSFDHVIECLVKYCNHDAIQAEQCAWIVHLKGKCSVKSGSYDDLEPVCVALCDKGLSAQIEMN
ncbi:MAG: ATP-dependent Clp protease adaptor ClpS [Bacteroidia bacterium]|nr:ATP-dependent Clp protease adaptor ClpS [Bacteroidia bacterium]